MESGFTYSTYDYPLKDVPAMEKADVINKKKVVLDGIKKRRSEMN